MTDIPEDADITAEEMTSIRLKYWVPEMSTGKRLKALSELPIDFLINFELLSGAGRFRVWKTAAFYPSEQIYIMLARYERLRREDMEYINNEQTRPVSTGD